MKSRRDYVVGLCFSFSFGFLAYAITGYPLVAIITYFLSRIVFYIIWVIPFSFTNIFLRGEEE